MMATAPRSPVYVLGHSGEEQRRLDAAGVLLRPVTERLLREAGVRPGLRVLDVGCGTGDVTRLAAEMVGSTGAVVGIDRAAAVLAAARERPAAPNSGEIEYAAADLATFADPAPFDAVVGRFVLMYQADPVAVLRHLAGLVRPGGVLAFLDFVFHRPTGRQRPLYRQVFNWLYTTFEQSGAWMDLGARLPTMFVSAGLPAPCTWLEVVEIVGADTTTLTWLADTMRSLLPAIERFGVATAEEIEIATLRDRLLAEAAAAGGTVAGPTLAGVWTRTGRAALPGQTAGGAA
jgi:SAM-dependent methyltransferase